MRRVVRHDGALRNLAILNDLVPDKAPVRPQPKVSSQAKSAGSNYVECAKMIESVDKVMQQAQMLMQESGTDLLQSVLDQAGQMKETLVGVLQDMTQLDAVNEAFDGADGAGPMTPGQPVMPTQGTPVMPTAGAMRRKLADGLDDAINEVLQRSESEPGKYEMGPGGGWDDLIKEVAEKHGVHWGDVEFAILTASKTSAAEAKTAVRNIKQEHYDKLRDATAAGQVGVGETRDGRSFTEYDKVTVNGESGQIYNLIVDDEGYLEKANVTVNSGKNVSVPIEQVEKLSRLKQGQDAPEVGWGSTYGGSGPSYETPEGPVWMFRKGQAVRFYDQSGQQVGPEQSNVAPAIAYAMSEGWRDLVGPTVGMRKQAPRYSGDPRWIDVRYPTTCTKCNRQIAKGESAFYYPNGKQFYCDQDGCGGDASRDFDAHAFDEDFGGGMSYSKQAQDSAHDPMYGFEKGNQVETPDGPGEVVGVAPFFGGGAQVYVKTQDGATQVYNEDELTKTAGYSTRSGDKNELSSFYRSLELSSAGFNVPFEKPQFGQIDRNVEIGENGSVWVYPKGGVGGFESGNWWELEGVPDNVALAKQAMNEDYTCPNCGGHGRESQNGEFLEMTPGAVWPPFSWSGQMKCENCGNTWGEFSESEIEDRQRDYDQHYSSKLREMRPKIEALAQQVQRAQSGEWVDPNEVQVGDQVHFLDKNGMDRFGKVTGEDEGTYRIVDAQGHEHETDYIMNKMAQGRI